MRSFESDDDNVFKEDEDYLAAIKTLDDIGRNEDVDLALAEDTNESSNDDGDAVS